MAWFTKQEKKIIIFILAALILGEGIWLHKKYLANNQHLEQEETFGPKVPIRNYKVDINKASAKELITLPQIGPSTAQKIIKYRETHGGFLFIEDLKNVKGIGEKKFQKLKEYVKAE